MFPNTLNALHGTNTFNLLLSEIDWMHYILRYRFLVSFFNLKLLKYFYASNKKSEMKNTKLNEKPKTKRLLQKLKRKRDKKLAKIKKRKGEEVSSPPPHTGAVNPAFNNSIRDDQTEFSPERYYIYLAFNCRLVGS